MNLADKVTQAQTAILAALVEMEDEISRLYEAYAAHKGANTSTWLELAGDERKHADLLRSVARDVAQGHVLYNVGRFRRNDIQTLTDLIRRNVADFHQNGGSIRRELEVAFEIEKSLLEGHFYDVVNTDAPAFQEAARILVNESLMHRNMLHQLLKNLPREDV